MLPTNSIVTQCTSTSIFPCPYIYTHIIILLKTTLKLGTTGYELHGTGVSDRFGKGPHPLLWANSRPECVQTTIRLIPKQLCNLQYI